MDLPDNPTSNANPLDHGDDDEHLGSADDLRVTNDSDADSDFQDTDGDTTGNGETRDPNDDGDHEGGIFAFPDEDPAEAVPWDPAPIDPATATEPHDKQPSPSPALHVGDLVSPPDYDNVGVVIDVGKHSTLVQFTNRDTGVSTEKWFGHGELKLLRKGGGDAPPIRILTYGEVLCLEQPPAIVEGVLRQHELGMVYGASGVGKTFFVIHLVLCVAANLPWLGRAVVQTFVLYIAAEGAYGLRARMLAWMQVFAPKAFDALQEFTRFIPSPVQLLDDEEFHRFLAVLEVMAKGGLRFGLIVIDTLARCAAGGDENSARDMGELVKRCDKVRETSGAAVLLVHHSGKDGKSERGSTALRGAADVMIRLAASGKEQVEINCAKIKDGKPFSPIRVVLKHVPAVDERTGEELHSCVVEEVVGRAGKSLLSPREEQLLLDVYRSFRDREASKTELKDASRAAKSTFYAAVTSLTEKGFLERRTDGRSEKYRLTKTGLALARSLDAPSTRISDRPSRNSTNQTRTTFSAERQAEAGQFFDGELGPPKKDLLEPDQPKSQETKNQETKATPSGRVQSSTSLPLKGGETWTGLDCTSGNGPVQESKPVQNSPEQETWTRDEKKHPSDSAAGRSKTTDDDTAAAAAPSIERHEPGTEQPTSSPGDTEKDPSGDDRKSPT